MAAAVGNRSVSGIALTYLMLGVSERALASRAYNAAALVPFGSNRSFAPLVSCKSGQYARGGTPHASDGTFASNLTKFTPNAQDGHCLRTPENAFSVTLQTRRRGEEHTHTNLTPSTLLPCLFASLSSSPHRQHEEIAAAVQDALSSGNTLADSKKTNVAGDGMSADKTNAGSGSTRPSDKGSSRMGVASGAASTIPMAQSPPRASSTSAAATVHSGCTTHGDAGDDDARAVRDAFDAVQVPNADDDAAAADHPNSAASPASQGDGGGGSVMRGVRPRGLHPSELSAVAAGYEMLASDTTSGSGASPASSGSPAAARAPEQDPLSVPPPTPPSPSLTPSPAACGRRHPRDNTDDERPPPQPQPGPQTYVQPVPLGRKKNSGGDDNNSTASGSGEMLLPARRNAHPRVDSGGAANMIGAGTMFSPLPPSSPAPPRAQEVACLSGAVATSAAAEQAPGRAGDLDLLLDDDDDNADPFYAQEHPECRWGARNAARAHQQYLAQLARTEQKHQLTQGERCDAAV